MRIAIAIAITLAIAAALAPLQQARGWAATCADGNTDVCCHLEQIWSTSTAIQVFGVATASEWAKLDVFQCDPATQRQWDQAIPLMCQTDCWGGAMGWNGIWSAAPMPTQAGVLITECTVTHFVNGTCPPPAAPTPTPAPSPSSSTAEPTPSSSTASATESSSTASATESSSSSTGTDANAHGTSTAALGPAHEDSIGAAAPQRHSLWAFALAFALGLWH
jgi:hypothetical protein